MTNSTGFLSIDTYHYIINYALTHKGNTPSQRQIASGCGFSNATAHYHTQILISQGLLERIDGELCVSRGIFSVPPNIFDIADIDRNYPDITDMKVIPKEIVGLGQNIEEYGISVGDAADQEFLSASYPIDWKYILSPLTDQSIEIYNLVNENGLIQATLRFNKTHYKATLNFWKV